MEFTPIASLEQLSGARSKYIKGIVTLVWPFSSSSKKVAFLVAEPDFRLRNSKGQVRVQLRGPASLAVAKSKLGIGDEVIFGLDGAQWIAAEPGVSTPGKSMELELLYKNILVLEVCGCQWSALNDTKINADNTKRRESGPTIYK